MKSSYMSVHSSPENSPQCDESFKHVNTFAELNNESIFPNLMILPQQSIYSFIQCSLSSCSDLNHWRFFVA